MASVSDKPNERIRGIIIIEALVARLAELESGAVLAVASGQCSPSTLRSRRRDRLEEEHRVGGTILHLATAA